jgi:hypothetical protein
MLSRRRTHLDDALLVDLDLARDRGDQRVVGQVVPTTA